MFEIRRSNTFLSKSSHAANVKPNQFLEFQIRNFFFFLIKSDIVLLK